MASLPSATWSGTVYVTGSVFLNPFKNIIDSARLPDRTRRYFNVGKANTKGFEVQVQKNLSWLAATANDTYLDHRYDTDNRPMDAQSKHNLNFDVSFLPAMGFRVGF